MLHGYNNRLDYQDKSLLEDIAIKSIQAKNKTKKKIKMLIKKSEQGLLGLWEASSGQERRIEEDKTLERILAKNVPNFMSNINHRIKKLNKLQAI